MQLTRRQSIRCRKNYAACVILAVFSAQISFYQSAHAAPEALIEDCNRVASATYDYDNSYSAIPDDELENSPQLIQESEEICRRALEIDATNARTNFQLGRILILSGRPEEGTKFLTESAGANYPAAQYLLGVVYHNGSLGKSDMGEAVKWWSMAAEQGHADSQHLLGATYLLGRGVDVDLKRALDWLQKSAEQGNAGAQYLLGSMYYEGKQVPQDTTKAFQLFKNASDQGIPQAQFASGMMYLSGVGTDKNTDLGLQLLDDSASQGFPLAQLELGKVYFDGVHVEKNVAIAKRWFCKLGAFGRETYRSLSGEILQCVDHQ